MAKNKYWVQFDIVLCTDRVIAADTEDEALRIAKELRFDDQFFDDIACSWENDCEMWRGRNCEVNVWGKASDEEPAVNEKD